MLSSVSINIRLRILNKTKKWHKDWNKERLSIGKDHIISFLFFFAVPGIERRGVLPLRYTPGPIFLCFIFETRSHEVAEGLTR